MKTIIAGSREITDYDQVKQAVEDCGWNITSVVSGTANGVDLLGEEWATINGIVVERFPANWSLGKSAGHIRNLKMAKCSEALIAVWDGKSQGTKNMILTALQKDLQIHIHYVNDEKAPTPFSTDKTNLIKNSARGTL